MFSSINTGGKSTPYCNAPTTQSSMIQPENIVINDNDESRKLSINNAQSTPIQSQFGTTNSNHTSLTQTKANTTTPPMNGAVTKIPNISIPPAPRTQTTPFTNDAMTARHDIFAINTNVNTSNYNNRNKNNLTIWSDMALQSMNVNVNTNATNNTSSAMIPQRVGQSTGIQMSGNYGSINNTSRGTKRQGTKRMAVSPMSHGTYSDSDGDEDVIVQSPILTMKTQSDPKRRKTKTKHVESQFTSNPTATYAIVNNNKNINLNQNQKHNENASHLIETTPLSGSLLKHKENERFNPFGVASIQTINRGKNNSNIFDKLQTQQSIARSPASGNKSAYPWQVHPSQISTLNQLNPKQSQQLHTQQHQKGYGSHDRSLKLTSEQSNSTTNMLNSDYNQNLQTLQKIGSQTPSYLLQYPKYWTKHDRTVLDKMDRQPPHCRVNNYPLQNDAMKEINNLRKDSIRCDNKMIMRERQILYNKIISHLSSVFEMPHRFMVCLL